MEGNAIVSNDVLKGIADAIREGLGTTEEMVVAQMAGGVKKLTEGELNFGGMVVKTRLTSIGDGVFENCGSLASVSLPACTTTGEYAFTGCGVLTSVSLPSCTSVGNYALAGCYSLTSIDLSSIPLDEVVANASTWVVPSGCTITCKNGEQYIVE